MVKCHTSSVEYSHRVMVTGLTSFLMQGPCDARVLPASLEMEQQDEVPEICTHHKAGGEGRTVINQK